jgi:antitoxin component YwqK of YwqJK toxin-antitoxin module
MSITEYSHGIRNGLMVVKHLNGQISYTGEFKNGDKIGIWRSYSENGELIEEKDWTGK